MKKIILYTTVLLSAVMYSCQDKIDVDPIANSYPPAILKVYPLVSVKTGDFPLKVVLVDGPGSPLKTGTLTLKDGDGKQLYTITKDVSGLKDSIIVAGSVFSASSLPLGNYTLDIDVADTQGNTTTQSNPFKISQTLYPANNTQMYLAGDFNNWGASEMELISDFTWQIKNVDLIGKAFKIKNTTDWSDKNYGDDNCTGVASTTGGNITCGSSGLVNIQFNDKTLAYTIKPAVNFKSKVSGLYLLGSMNEFEGAAYKFNLIADDSWELGEIRLKAGDEFKFSQGSNFSGPNYGDTNMDGKAELYGNNITLANGFADAFYKVAFNDLTLKYTFTLLRYPFPDKIFLMGGATTAGWDPTKGIPFVKLSDGKFEIYASLTNTDGFKFLPTNAGYADDWGADPSIVGGLLQTGEVNATVADDGFYRILLDFTNKTYSATLITTWGVIGDFNSWGASVPMTYVSGYKWQVDVDFATTGAFKFRANNGWDINFGYGGSAGTLQFNGSTNIAIPATGVHHVELNLDPVNGYSYTITP